ncbi:TRAP transporter small permease [Achromobacter mucicolens]|uniref:TRAP transporter small permease n=1 Tax=Achromobacter mucicolens TaxID=1389922 RepID=UPI00320B6A3A
MQASPLGRPGPSRPGRSPLARAADWCFALQTWLMVACLVIMVVLLFGNVALRYLFNSGINVSDEVSRLAFVWMIFLGSVIALREHQHIGVTMLVDRFGPGARRVSHIACQLMILWVLWLMAEGSWVQTVIGLDTVLPVTGMPQAVFNAAGLYAAVAMGILTVVDLVRVIAGGPLPAESSPEDPLV